MELERETAAGLPDDTDAWVASIRALGAKRVRQGRALKTRCKRGHALVGQNVLIGRCSGRPAERRCRLCFNAYQRERMRRVRAAVKAKGS